MQSLIVATKVVDCLHYQDEQKVRRCALFLERGDILLSAWEEDSTFLCEVDWERQILLPKMRLRTGCHLEGKERWFASLFHVGKKRGDQYVLTRSQFEHLLRKRKTPLLQKRSPLCKRSTLMDAAAKIAAELSFVTPSGKGASSNREEEKRRRILCPLQQAQEGSSPHARGWRRG